MRNPREHKQRKENRPMRQMFLFFVNIYKFQSERRVALRLTWNVKWRAAGGIGGGHSLFQYYVILNLKFGRLVALGEATMMTNSDQLYSHIVKLHTFSFVTRLVKL